MIEIKKETILNYFSRKDWVIIIVLSVFAVLFGYFGIPAIVPGSGGAGFVHGMLKLPGPGTGTVISGAFICFWLILGYMITKKPGTMFLIIILITLIRILWGATVGIIPTDGHNAVAAVVLGSSIASVGLAGVIARLDILPVLGLILEGVYLVPVDKKPWKFIIPSIVAILGLVTVVLIVTGQTTMTEGVTNASASSLPAAAPDFPIGYGIVAIVGFCVAVICYRYPVKYVVCGGIGTMYYIFHYWMFWGKKGIASSFPALNAIPVIFLYAFSVGALLAALAIGIDLLWKMYRGTDTSLPKDQ